MQRLKDSKGLPKQENKYHIPHLKVSLEAIFSKIIQSNKKVFTFRQEKYSVPIFVEITCFEHLQ